MKASVHHELEPDRLGEYLAGPPDPELVTEFAELWRDT